MGFYRRLRTWWQIRAGSEATPLDGDAPSWFISMLVHMIVLVALMLVTASKFQEKTDILLTSRPVDLEEETEPEEFQFDEEEHDTAGALSFGGDQSPEAAALAESTISEVSTPFEIVVDTGNIAVTQVEEFISDAPEIEQDVVVQGVGAVGVSGASGAIDRISHEILQSLEQRPTLVVWVFDKSGSLQSQRELIQDRLDRIYADLETIENSGSDAFRKHADKPLLSSVVAFGQTVEFLTEKPTDNAEAIRAAISGIDVDISGKENVFQAVYKAADKYRRMRTQPKHRRNVMIVVFTDEAGDDTNGVDATVDLCRRYGMPVYVVGVPAPFGRDVSFIKYVDPDPNFDQTPQWVPVQQGPETLYPERIKLRFVGDSDREEPLDSGFGPFCLTRLCYETSGIYFAIHPNRESKGRVSRGRTSEMTAYVSQFFDSAVMRNYRPDYTSVKEYQKLLSQNKAKAALTQASRQSWTTQMAAIRLRFPKQSEPQLATLLTRAQRSAAKLEPKIRQILHHAKTRRE